jgi:hypothetical protein
MRKCGHIFGIVFALFLLSLASEQRLMAYADPGSGAMFVQILLAGIVGCLFRVRSFVNRFRNWRNRAAPQGIPEMANDNLARPSE